MKLNSPAQLAGMVFAVTLLSMSGKVQAAGPGVDAWVEDQLESGDKVSFILRMKEQADTSDLRLNKDLLSRRANMVDRLRTTAEDSQAALRERLDSLGVEYRPFWITNAILVSGDQQLLDELKARDDIAHIHANPEVALDLPSAETVSDSPEAIEWGVSMIGAPEVWSQGFDGTGVVVAGQDTGYQWDHPALINSYRGWNGSTADHNYNWHDAIHVNNGSCSGNSPFPCDDNNHGTHTMGTMVGDDGGSNQIGVAPGAKWISCRNMNNGSGTPASYIECFEWFVAPTDLNGQNPDPAKAPHVINNSWSCPPSEGCTDPNVMLDVVNNVVDAGIMVVVSAGNAGPGCSSVSTPSAIYDASFSVGATDINDAIAGFSSRGPVTVDGSGRMKPDISAPGVQVRSSIRNNSYASFNGTSMAGPHVVGLVALMISADPDLAGDITTLRGRIENNAVQLTTAQECGGVPGSEIPNNTYGHGRIDAEASVMQIPEDFFDHSFETPQE